MSSRRHEQTPGELPQANTRSVEIGRDLTRVYWREIGNWHIEVAIDGESGPDFISEGSEVDNGKVDASQGRHGRI